MGSQQLIAAARTIARVPALAAAALLLQGLSLHAAECGASGNERDAFVGVYAEWPGLSDAQSRHHDGVLLDHLSTEVDDSALSYCLVSKIVFPQLASEGLFNLASVRRMITGTAVLAGNETFARKLQTFRIKYLVFVKADPTAGAQFSVVRFDPSGAYTKENFARGHFDTFDRESKEKFFDKVAGSLKKLSQPPPVPEFPVIVTCFVDEVGSTAQQGWKMNELKILIPKKLAAKLYREKPHFKTPYPVRFEENCPFKGADRSAYASKYDDRWFAWTGVISLRGMKIHVAIDFVHAATTPWPVEWTGEIGRVDIYKLHEEIAATIASEWDAYLDSVRPQRGDLPPTRNLTSGALR